MKLAWKLAIPQICIVVCLSLISFITLNASFINRSDRYVRDIIQNRFMQVEKGIISRAQESVRQTSVFLSLPDVLQAYEIALGGDIDDPYSPQAQEAREMLRNELAPMLDSYEKETGHKMQLHFHLPNGLSLVRLWRDKQTMIDGKWVDISDNIVSVRPTIVNVIRNQKTTMGVEPGIGGFSVRGVVPLKAPDGRQIGSAEVLQEFEPILDIAREEGKVFIALYANKELLDFAVALRDEKKHPQKGDFVRVVDAKNDSIESLITPELLFYGKNNTFFEKRGSTTIAASPLADFMGKQVGILVCAANIEDTSRSADIATIILPLLLVGLAVVPSVWLLLGLRFLILRPLHTIISLAKRAG
jgi:hypothetical protein